MTGMKRLALITSFVFAAAGSAFGEDKPKTDSINPADLSVPDAPAFVLLGVTPQKVTRPATPTAFASSLLTSVDDRGKLQNGLAVDTSPYLLEKGNNLTIDDYRKNWYLRFLAGTTLSMATTKEASGDTQHLATGLHFTLFDFGDPRRDTDLDTCFDKAAGALPAPQLGAEPGAPAVITDVKGPVAKEFENCRAKSAKRQWNRSSWIVAAGKAWLSSSGTASDLESDGDGLWTSAAWGFEPFDKSWLYKHAQLIGHARWRNGEHVTDTNKVTTDHDRRVFGARFRFGSPNMNGSVEWTRQSDDTSTKKTSGRTLLIGVEQRVADGIWLDLSVGREFGRRENDTHLVARSSFHWSFNTKPSRSPIPE